jgi:hypothetical protein
VDGIKFFRGIPPGQLENDSGTSRVLLDEVRHIVDVAVEDDPAAFGGTVFRDCRLVSAKKPGGGIRGDRAFFCSKYLGHLEFSAVWVPQKPQTMRTWLRIIGRSC